MYDVTTYRDQKLGQTSVQAQILAGSVAAALAFDDANTAQEYLDALGADPDIQAAAAYTSRGVLFASFVRPGAAPPPTFIATESVSYDENLLIVTKEVVQGADKSGYVLLETAT